jgi:predicted aspartyl protease
MLTCNAAATLAAADARRRQSLDRRAALHWLVREGSMGRINVETTIENGTDAAFSIRCDALVDTGAAYLTLPNAWRDRLGELTRLATVDVQVANQTVVSGEICGPVLLRMERFRPVLAEVLFIDMNPTDGRYEPLIGYIPLEQAQAVVDLVGHRLVKVNLVDLK